MTAKQPKRKQREGVDSYGRTPLHYAAADSKLDEVARLLAVGANVNAQDDNGWSPLHFAAQASSSECTAESPRVPWRLFGLSQAAVVVG